MNLHIYVLLILTVCNVAYCKKNGIAMWWNIKPYVYQNEKGRISGILVDIMNNINIYCPAFGFNLDYSNDLFNKSFHDFMTVMESNFTSANISSIIERNNSEFVWFPVISPVLDLKENTYALRYLFKASGAYVVIRRDVISLPMKIGVGVREASNLIILSCLFAICVGILVWLCVS